ncbi:MAG TPA: acetoacetate decarboxylase family protein [Thermoanaerobaculia bacterium]|jgi:hypothetical protein|nr:acetoacetate decarboxylase family protein [Thermoanaerobaculia bacterium]
MPRPQPNAEAAVSRIAPPWRLRGNGYVFVFTFQPWFLRSGGFLPPELGESFEGQLGALVLADYSHSPVGPFRELLFLAGRNRRWRNHRFSITRAYVSTEASAANGRESWGIPKQTADFEVIRGEAGAERVIVLRNGLAEVDLTIAPAKGRALPAFSLFLLPSWRTIVQFQNGKVIETRWRGRGVLRPAKLIDFRALPAAFPDVSQGAVMAGYRVGDLRLRMPEAAKHPSVMSEGRDGL